MNPSETLAKSPVAAQYSVAAPVNYVTRWQIWRAGMGEHRWVGSVGLAAAVGVLYYLVAYLSLTGLFFISLKG
jgi:hypothetical protein